jgi:hypothetical protein
MKKHQVIALVGTLALLANLIVPGLAFGQVPQAQTGTADIGCSLTAPAYTAVVPAAAFDFTTDGANLNPGVNSLVASNVEQYAFNTANGAELNFATGNDYVQINDIRDPSLAGCNDGLTLTLEESDNSFADAGGHSIPITDLKIVTSTAACVTAGGYAVNGICYDADALCGEGDPTAAATCTIADGTSIAMHTGDTLWNDIATYDTDGVNLDSAGGAKVLISAPDDHEIYGKAAVGVAFGLRIPAAQPSGTYTADLVYTLTPL